MNPYLDLLSRNRTLALEQALSAEQAGRFDFAGMMLDRAVELEAVRNDAMCWRCRGTGYAGPYGDTCRACEGEGLREQQSDPVPDWQRD